MAKRASEQIRFSNVRLLVDDFARSWNFYRDVLGLRPAPGHGAPPYGEFLSRGRAVVGIFERSLMSRAIGIPGRASPKRGIGTFALVLEVPDVDRTAQRLRRLRIQWTAGPTDREAWGIRTVHVQDPDGNLVEIFSRPRKGR